eukprot:TRINITY_DN258_c0_g1_i2.p1 TRINITY_DN258_c0_g1~~TRINITY_DN258_c0_g1_i2.p1  ORF type:complete len:261 (+),score=35.31 TRINITY_DN258_c0_g1_i2:60-842(+)
MHCFCCSQKLSRLSSLCSACATRDVAAERALVARKLAQRAALRAETQRLEAALERQHTAAASDEALVPITPRRRRPSALAAARRLADAEQAVAQWRDAIDTLASRVEAANEAAALAETAVAASSCVQPGTMALRHIRNLENVSTRVEKRLDGIRRKLLQTLLCFFPCNPISETAHRIVNITLPNDSRLYASMDPVIVTAALSHASRLLSAAAVYLDVWLPPGDAGVDRVNLHVQWLARCMGVTLEEPVSQEKTLCVCVCV